MTASPAREWLTARVERSRLAALEQFVTAVAGHLSVATADAVSVRRLSEDGRSLVPVAAHHPDTDRGAAMLEVMWRTTGAHEGLWRPVVEQRRTARWSVTPEQMPTEASGDQAAFLGQHTIRAVLGVPLVRRDRLVGGLALVRFGVDRPFGDEDEALATGCASALADAVDDLTTSLARLDRG